MIADAYLSHTVRNIPTGMVFCGGDLRPHVRHYVNQGVVRIIAGPEMVHVVIEIQRPYYRPKALLRITCSKGGGA
jgi:hypothetical protein